MANEREEMELRAKEVDLMIDVQRILEGGSDPQGFMLGVEICRYIEHREADLRGRCEAMERMLREAKAVAFEGGFLLLQAGDWVWFTGEYLFGISRSVHKRQSIIEAFEAAMEAGKEQTK